MAVSAAVPGGAGYSGTPLAKKLGVVAASRVCAIDAPFDYRAVVAPWPAGASLQKEVDRTTDIAHLFVRERARLEREAGRLRRAMRDDAVLWVSWPKKTARVATDISEDAVRAVALPLGWVDVKVCAVDATWSGLELVVRRELRA
jgi:hypothetical protein